MIFSEDLTFSYTGAAPFVLRNLQLQVPDAAYVSVVGENGCGKSTLLRLILGFLKPTAGELSCSASRIGYVPQKSNFASDGFPITVFEVLDSYRRLLKLADRQEVTRCLQQVGLLSKLHATMASLSGGQSQKVRIARALMGSPQLLVLDEPSTGVDIQSQREIYALLKELNVKSHMTILSVEHNLHAAIKNSTDIYHMTHGQGHLCSPQQYAQEMLDSSERRIDDAAV